MAPRRELLSPAGLRQDNRRPHELRSVSFSIHPQQLLHASGADGVSEVSLGLTQVIVQVFGPRENTSRTTSALTTTTTTTTTSTATNTSSSSTPLLQHHHQDVGCIHVEISTGSFSTQDRRKVHSRLDKKTQEMSSVIANTFESVVMLTLYPRSVIDIHVHIIQQDGSVLAAAINATTLALVAAGISLTDYVSAIAVAALPSPPCPLVDITHTEETDLPHVTVASLFRSERLTLIQMEARLSIDQFDRILNVALEGCKVIKKELEAEAKKWAHSLVRNTERLQATTFHDTEVMDTR